MAGRLVPVDSRFRGNDGVGLPSIFIAMTVKVASDILCIRLFAV